MRLKLARGPVVEALKRYDPGLRVRWSYEKKKWAVDAPFKFNSDAREGWLVPPVRFIPIGNSDQFEERLLPERSERYIEYHSRRYTICWAKSLDWRLFYGIARRDSHRGRNLAVGMFDRAMAEKNSADFKAEEYRKSERVYAGWDMLKHKQRKAGLNGEDAIGVSIKGMK